MGAFDAVLADDRSQLDAFVEDQRTTLLATLDGMTNEQVRRRLVPSATTLLGLVKHVTWMQRVWFEECIAGVPRRELGLVATADDSFLLDDTDTAATVAAAFRQACATARQVAADVPLDAVVTGHRSGPRTVRWVYLQVLRELAQHAGHADILREQLRHRQPITSVTARVRVDDLATAVPVYEVLTASRARRFEFGAAQLAAVGPFLLFSATDDDGDRLAGVVATLATDDLDGQLATVVAAGGVVVAPPAATPNGRRAVVRHPDGSVFEYVGR